MDETSPTRWMAPLALGAAGAAAAAFPVFVLAALIDHETAVEIGLWTGLLCVVAGLIGSGVACFAREGDTRRVARLGLLVALVDVALLIALLAAFIADYPFS